MKQLVLLWVFLLATGASAARAGLHLAYNDCGSGIVNMNTACTTNAGGIYVVASFDAPPGTTAITGEEAVVDAQLAGGVVPPWWQIGRAGACRTSGMTVWFFPAGPSCADYFNKISVPLGGSAFDYYPAVAGIAPGRVRIHAVSVVEFSLAKSLEATGIAPGTNTFVFTIVIWMKRTVESGSCAGCDVPACLVFNSLKLAQPPLVGDIMIASPGTGGAYVTWQGGAVGSGPYGSGCPGATPTQRTSWGQMKSLYR